MIRAGLLCAVLVSMPLIAAAQTSGDQTVSVVAETRVDSLTRDVASQLRCPVCQGLSIQDSPSPLAQDMRAIIHEQLTAGKTPEEVKQYFVQRYSEWILLAPEAKGFNLAVYVLPVIAVLLGIAAIAFSSRKWLKRPPAETGVPADETDPDLASWEEISTR